MADKRDGGDKPASKDDSTQKSRCGGGEKAGDSKKGYTAAAHATSTSSQRPSVLPFPSSSVHESSENTSSSAGTSNPSSNVHVSSALKDIKQRVRELTSSSAPLIHELSTSPNSGAYYCLSSLDPGEEEDLVQGPDDTGATLQESAALYERFLQDLGHAPSPAGAAASEQRSRKVPKLDVEEIERQLAGHSGEYYLIDDDLSTSSDDGCDLYDRTLDTITEEDSEDLMSTDREDEGAAKQEDAVVPETTNAKTSWECNEFNSTEIPDNPPYAKQNWEDVEFSSFMEESIVLSEDLGSEPDSNKGDESAKVDSDGVVPNLLDINVTSLDHAKALIVGPYRNIKGGPRDNVFNVTSHHPPGSENVLINDKVKVEGDNDRNSHKRLSSSDGLLTSTKKSKDNESDEKPKPASSSHDSINLNASNTRHKHSKKDLDTSWKVPQWLNQTAGYSNEIPLVPPLDLQSSEDEEDYDDMRRSIHAQKNTRKEISEWFNHPRNRASLSTIHSSLSGRSDTNRSTVEQFEGTLVQSSESFSMEGSYDDFNACQAPTREEGVASRLGKYSDSSHSSIMSEKANNDKDKSGNNGSSSDVQWNLQGVTMTESKDVFDDDCKAVSGNNSTSNISSNSSNNMTNSFVFEPKSVFQSKSNPGLSSDSNNKMDSNSSEWNLGGQTLTESKDVIYEDSDEDSPTTPRGATSEHSPWNLNTHTYTESKDVFEESSSKDSGKGNTHNSVLRDSTDTLLIDNELVQSLESFEALDEIHNGVDTGTACTRTTSIKSSPVHLSQKPEDDNKNDAAVNNDAVVKSPPPHKTVQTLKDMVSPTTSCVESPRSASSDGTWSSMSAMTAIRIQPKPSADSSRMVHGDREAEESYTDSSSPTPTNSPRNNATSQPTGEGYLRKDAHSLKSNENKAIENQVISLTTDKSTTLGGQSEKKIDPCESSNTKDEKTEKSHDVKECSSSGRNTSSPFEVTYDHIEYRIKEPSPTKEVPNSRQVFVKVSDIPSYPIKSNTQPAFNAGVRGQEVEKPLMLDVSERRDSVDKTSTEMIDSGKTYFSPNAKSTFDTDPYVVNEISSKPHTAANVVQFDQMEKSISTSNNVSQLCTGDNPNRLVKGVENNTGSAINSGLRKQYPFNSTPRGYVKMASLGESSLDEQVQRSDLQNNESAARENPTSGVASPMQLKSPRVLANLGIGKSRLEVEKSPRSVDADDEKKKYNFTTSSFTQHNSQVKHTTRYRSSSADSPDPEIAFLNSIIDSPRSQASSDHESCGHANFGATEQPHRGSDRAVTDGSHNVSNVCNTPNHGQQLGNRHGVQESKHELLSDQQEWPSERQLAKRRARSASPGSVFYLGSPRGPGEQPMSQGQAERPGRVYPGQREHHSINNESGQQSLHTDHPMRRDPPLYKEHSAQRGQPAAAKDTRSYNPTQYNEQTSMNPGYSNAGQSKPAYGLANDQHHGQMSQQPAYWNTLPRGQPYLAALDRHLDETTRPGVAQQPGAPTRGRSPMPNEQVLVRYLSPQPGGTGSVTAHATSTALAKKEPVTSPSSNAGGTSTSHALVSAMASAEATGDNPYIAVARATARAATIASASAAREAVSGGDTDQGGPNRDITMMISTSCTIRGQDEEKIMQDCSDVIETMGDGVQVSVGLSHKQEPTTSKPPIAEPQSPREIMRPSGPKPKRLKITLENEDPLTSNIESRTIECALPSSCEQQDLVKVVGDAVKHILAASDPHTQDYIMSGQGLEATIERVTKQVITAYNESKGSPKRSSPKRGSPKNKPKKALVSSPETARMQALEVANRVRLMSPDSSFFFVNDDDEFDGIEKLNDEEMVMRVTEPHYEMEYFPLKVQAGDSCVPEEEPVRDNSVTEAKKQEEQMPKFISTAPNSAVRQQKVPYGGTRDLSAADKGSLSDKRDPKQATAKLKSSQTAAPAAASGHKSEQAYHDHNKNEQSTAANTIQRPVKSVVKDKAVPHQRSKSVPPREKPRPTEPPPPIPPRQKPVYKSVLQEPVKDSKTPQHILKKFELPDYIPSGSRKRVEHKRSDFLESGSVESLNTSSSSSGRIISPREYNLKSGASDNWPDQSRNVLGKVPTETKPKSKLDELKHKLDNIRPTPPPKSYVDNVWNAGELLAKSQERGLNVWKDTTRSRYSTHSADPSVNYPDRRQSHPELSASQGDTEEGQEDQEENLKSPLSKSLSSLHEVDDMRKIPEEFDRTQSMYAIPTPQQQRHAMASERPRNDSFLSDDESVMSEQELRVSRSLNMLDIPDWYRNSPRHFQEIVLLENAHRRDRSFELPIVTPTSLSPVPDTVRPVVIQHRVNSYIRATPESSTVSTPVSGPPEVELPSKKIRDGSREFSKMEIKELHVKIDAIPQRRHAAREAYLRLKQEKWENRAHPIDPSLVQQHLATLHNQDQSRADGAKSPSGDSRELYYPHQLSGPVTQRAKYDNSERTTSPRDQLSTATTANRRSTVNNAASYNDQVNTQIQQSVSQAGARVTFKHDDSSSDHLGDSAYASLALDSNAGSTPATPDKPLNISSDNDNAEVSARRFQGAGPFSKYILRDKDIDRVNKEAMDSNAVKDGDLNQRNRSHREDQTKESQYRSKLVSTELNMRYEKFDLVETAKPDDNKARAMDNETTKVATAPKKQHERQTTLLPKTKPPKTAPKPKLANKKDIEDKSQYTFQPISPNSTLNDSMLSSGSSSKGPHKELGLLEYEGSPGAKRRGTYKPHPVVQEFIEFTGFDVENDMKVPRLSQNGIDGKETSLEEVIDGLLGMPSPNSDKQLKTPPEVQPNETPLMRNFRVLKEAETPRSSRNTSRAVSMQSLLNISSGSGELNHSRGGGGANSSLNRSAFSLHEDEARDALGSEVHIVKCRNKKCGRSAELVEAQFSFKTCHHCYTYYCSRECRKAHWERHKRKCLLSHVNSQTKHVIKRVHDDMDALAEMTRVARTGYLQKGRGCVMVVFSCPERADDFLSRGVAGLEVPACFTTTRELEESELLGDHLPEVVDMCRTYNPEIKFVFEVAIIPGDIPEGRPPPRHNNQVVYKSAKLRLSSAQSLRPETAKQPPKPNNDTLILTAMPGPDQRSEIPKDTPDRKARELCFVNIQTKLRQRGVSLRHQFPEVYGRLVDFVADGQHFTPITLFPVDGKTGKKFMCLIMPEADADVEWMHRPGLLEELGLSTSV